MKLIKATSFATNKPVWIVADKIVAVERRTFDLHRYVTQIITVEGVIEIKETPEEFLATLDKLHQ